MYEVTTIYVMPTEEGLPPRAILGRFEVEDEEAVQELDPSPQEMLESAQTVAVYSGDMGCWTIGGQPVDPTLAEKISAHAHDLGVPGF
jgi:hypothetical protein